MRIKKIERKGEKKCGAGAMHMMRRLKSIASGRLSVSELDGDLGPKRVKVDQDDDVKIHEEHPGERVDPLPQGMHEMKIRDDRDDNDYGETNRLLQTEAMPNAPLVNLFADAIKGPLLSSDTEVQIATLDLVFHSISLELSGAGQIGILIEKNIAEYVFEILRLSRNKDPLVIPCLRILDLLAAVEETFRQRLAIGFSTLLCVLHYVADIPLHPVQSQVMKLVLNCISNCPRIISISQGEELTIILTGMFGRYSSGELVSWECFQKPLFWHA